MSTTVTTKAHRVSALFLAPYMEKRGLDIDGISEKFNLRTSSVDAGLKDAGILAMETLWFRASRYTNLNVTTATIRATTLRQHIQSAHNDDISSFAKSVGENEAFVQDAIQRGALWVKGEIYLPAEVSSLLLATRLDVHVGNVCDGNNTAFARAYGVVQQQMHRWAHRDCFFCDGEIYMRRTEFASLEGSPLPDYAGAVRLADHIETVYGAGKEGPLLFARKHGISLLQVHRYLGYDSLWIMGDIYKNQSKFAINGVTPDFSK